MLDPELFKSIAVMTADVHVSLCRETVTYTARQQNIPGLACSPKSGGDETMRVTVGTRSIEKHRIFEIAMQPGFPHPQLGLIIDDTITDANGDIYRVQSWNNPDDIGAVYEFNAVYMRTKQIGVVGQ